MTAAIVTKFGTIIQASALEWFAERTRAFLERPIHHGNFGTLWERVAEWSESNTDSRGYAIAYYVKTREGYVGKPKGFDTYEDAKAWLDSDAGKIDRFFGAQILCGHRFTKSGRIVKVWGDAA